VQQINFFSVELTQGVALEQDIHSCAYSQLQWYNITVNYLLSVLHYYCKLPWRDREKKKEERESERELNSNAAKRGSQFNSNAAKGKGSQFNSNIVKLLSSGKLVSYGCIPVEPKF
jgi:hypothetical protein